MSCNRMNCVSVAASVSPHHFFLYMYFFDVYYPSSNQIYSRYIYFFLFMYSNLVIIKKKFTEVMKKMYTLLMQTSALVSFV